MFIASVLAFSSYFTQLSSILAASDSVFGGYGWLIAIVVIFVLGLVFISSILGLRYIPNDRVGILEKLISSKGSITEGHIIALNGEAGFQADLLRGGYHLRLWRFKYRVHTAPLVTIPQGKIGYVYA